MWFLDEQGSASAEILIPKAFMACVEGSHVGNMHKTELQLYSVSS